MATSRHAAAWLVLALLAGSGSPALADQTDPGLDPLFAELKAAATVDDARSVEARIWSVWGQSHNDATDQKMAAGAALLSSGDFSSALALFDQIVANAPAFAEGWNKRATTLFLMGRIADSERDIAKVLELEPRHFGALSGLSMCELRLNRTRGALDALQRAQAVDPNLPGIADNVRELKTRLARESI